MFKFFTKKKSIEADVENQNTPVVKAPTHKNDNKASVEIVQKYSVEDLKSIIIAMSDNHKQIEFEKLNLSVRAANCLYRESIVFIADILALPSAKIMRWPNFGQKSLNEICLKLEELHSMDEQCIARIQSPNKKTLDDRQNNSWMSAFTAEFPEISSTFEESRIFDDIDYLKLRTSLDTKFLFKADEYRFKFLIDKIDVNNPFSVLDIAPQWLLDMDISYFETDQRNKNVIEENGIKKLSDLQEYNLITFKRLPNIGIKSIRELAAYIIKAQSKGVPPTPENPECNDLSLFNNLGSSIEAIEDTKYQSILNRRLGFNTEFHTLEEIAQGLEITRERVRQIQKKVINNIIDEAYWDDTLKFKIQRILENKTQPIFLDELSRGDAWFEGFNTDNQELLKNVIYYFSQLEVNFINYNDRILLSNIDDDEFKEITGDLLETFECSLNLSYTIEDIELIISSRLEDIGAKELSGLMLDELFPNFNFSMIDGELCLVSLGNSLTSHLKSIVETLETPLHYSEIAELYKEKFGVNVPVRNIHARLNYAKFPLFDRGVYGSMKHLDLTDTEVKFVKKTAEEFILENKGKQWHSHEILKNIKFKDLIFQQINKYDLNIILLDSEEVSYLGKMIWSADIINNEADRIHIKETVLKVLQDSGCPLHVNDLKKKVNKIRSVGVNFETSLNANELYSRLDPATWGLVDRDFILDLSDWRTFKSKFFDYLDIVGVALHVSEIEEKLNQFTDNEEVNLKHVLGIIATDDRFKRWKDGFIGLSSWNNHGRVRFIEAFDRVIDSSILTISLEEIDSQISEILNYKYNKYRISQELSKIGFEYDKIENVYKKT